MQYCVLIKELTDQFTNVHYGPFSSEFAAMRFRDKMKESLGEKDYEYKIIQLFPDMIAQRNLY